MYHHLIPPASGHSSIYTLLLESKAPLAIRTGVLKLLIQKYQQRIPSSIEGICETGQ